MSTEIGILAFTLRGWELSDCVAASLKTVCKNAEVVRAVKCEALGPLSDSRLAKEIAADWWHKDVLIFIGAAGIAVRLIAPLLKHKAQDPAVLVIDEQGRFCISLLSGHLGGANDWARRTAKLLGAQPVITTATDVSDAFAADLFAEDNGLVITDFAAAKKVSARALLGLPIRIYAELPPESLRRLPAEEQVEFLPEERLAEADILIGIHDLAAEFAAAVAENVGNAEAVSVSAADDGKQELARSDRNAGIGLFLPPRCLWIGIGARRGVSETAVADAVEQGLAKLGLSPYAVAGLASIDLKKDEAGILNYAAAQDLPFRTFSKDDLQAVPGSYTKSAFVRSVTGVSNVCERAAMREAGRGAVLLLQKQIYDSVTIAVACTASYTAKSEDEYAEIP